MWENFTPNIVLDGPNDECYISYNYYDTDIYGTVTTALVKGNMEQFFILNGNHMEEYKKLLHLGFTACFDYFKRNVNLINKLSEKGIKGKE